MTSERIERIMDEEALARVAECRRWGGSARPRTARWRRSSCVSDSAGWLTGVTLDVAGGRIML